jgi:hypothetical protein
LPHEIVDRISENFDGKKPMERFLTESGGYARKVEDVEHAEQNPKYRSSDADSDTDTPFVGVGGFRDGEGTPVPEMSKDRPNLGPPDQQ